MAARAMRQACVTVAIVSLTGVLGLHAQQAPASGGLTPVPRVVWFSGVFHPADGQPIGPIETVTVRAYRDPQGGDPLWQETQDLVVGKDGRYSLLLGATLIEGLPLDPECYRIWRRKVDRPEGVPDRTASRHEEESGLGRIRHR